MIKKFSGHWPATDDIIPKLGTQNAFNFGLYLVDCIMYDQDQLDGKQFDQRYFDFLKENLRII